MEDREKDEEFASRMLTNILMKLAQAARQPGDIPFENTVSIVMEEGAVALAKRFARDMPKRSTHRYSSHPLVLVPDGKSLRMWWRVQVNDILGQKRTFQVKFRGPKDLKKQADLAAGLAQEVGAVVFPFEQTDEL